MKANSGQSMAYILNEDMIEDNFISSEEPTKK